MIEYQCKSPILFLIFNRFDTTKKVLAEIKKYKPKRLFIVSDGARSNKPDEELVVKQLRDYVLGEIDWDCELKTLFREKNWGCGLNLSSAITWFFDNVESGIVLEDDCVANISFFKYCDTLLELYKDNEKVMHISGSNFQLSDVSPHSYYFTNSCFIWGWASWRRAWKHYDYEMKSYSKNWDFNDYVTDRYEKNYWRQIFKMMVSGKGDTWDYQWFYAVWKNNGLSIMPRHNLVKNIGFGSGTHTSTETFLADLKTYEMEISSHPTEIKRNLKADRWHADIMQLNEVKYVSTLIKIVRKIHKMLEN